jgi:Ion transport protein
VAPGIDRLCSKPGEPGWYKCPEPYFCGAPQDYGIGLSNENFEQAPYMNFGITTFDNIGVGMLTIFQTITLEGWSDLMYMMMDSGSPIVAGVFFISLVFLGAFFLLNVILVVIISNYSETKNA